jgi:hypothetical protein
MGGVECLSCVVEENGRLRALKTETLKWLVDRATHPRSCNSYDSPATACSCGLDALIAKAEGAKRS